ncbi:peptidoglycan-binding protein [Novosphingobium aureum]|nr:peptidoglycan-binding protein [Novosphingobium aureum]
MSALPPVNAAAMSSADLAALTPAQRARVIYTQARSEVSDRLWQAALGDGGEEGRSGDRFNAAGRLGGLADLLGGVDRSATGRTDSLLSSFTTLMLPEQRGEPSTCGGVGLAGPGTALDPDADAAARSGSGGDGHGDTAAQASAGLSAGPNARYSGALGAAAQRTGLPAPALASIIDAEAAKGADGSWQAYSRNARSSAAGLGQFISSTWLGEARREGTWLNAMANERGWLDQRGRIRPGARSDLLALRYDPVASIEATADYARANLDGLRKAGVAVGSSVEQLAHAAYLGHHLGQGDAVRFYRGEIGSDRARVLLNAQIGTEKASRRIAAAGSAVSAHRAWLLDYVGRNVRPQAFTS